MPFKSRAQRRKFAALLLKGEITPEQYERWNRETGSAELPERVKQKRKPTKRKSKRATERKRKSNRLKKARKATPRSKTTKGHAGRGA